MNRPQVFNTGPLPFFRVEKAGKHAVFHTGKSCCSRARREQTPPVSLRSTALPKGEPTHLQGERVLTAKPLRHHRFARCHLSCQERLWQSVLFPSRLHWVHRKRNLSAKGSPDRKDSPGRGRWHGSAERGTAVAAGG